MRGDSWCKSFATTVAAVEMPHARHATYLTWLTRLRHFDVCLVFVGYGSSRTVRWYHPTITICGMFFERFDNYYVQKTAICKPLRLSTRVNEMNQGLCQHSPTICTNHLPWLHIYYDKKAIYWIKADVKIPLFSDYQKYLRKLSNRCCIIFHLRFNK